MQDKLIEAAQDVIDCKWGISWGHDDLRRNIDRLRAITLAVRAHDAGTGERESGFICAAWRKRFEGPMHARRTLVNRCDLPDGHDGKHLDHVLLVSWADDQSVEECRPRNEWNDPPASHAAESAPPLISEGCAYHGASSRICERGTGGCEIHHAAESAPQLDAEDPAEPVEDVVGEMLDVWFDEDMPENQDDRRKCMTRSLAVARKGYVKLEDAETAIEQMRSNWHQADQQLSDAHIRIAALEKLCQQQHEAVKRWRVHSIWIPAIGYSMGQEADKIIAAYDALFPKAGGAK